MNSFEYSTIAETPEEFVKEDRQSSRRIIFRRGHHYNPTDHALDILYNAENKARSLMAAATQKANRVKKSFDKKNKEIEELKRHVGNQAFELEARLKAIREQQATSTYVNPWPKVETDKTSHAYRECLSRYAAAWMEVRMKSRSEDFDLSRDLPAIHEKWNLGTLVQYPKAVTNLP